MYAEVSVKFYMDFDETLASFSPRSDQLLYTPLPWKGPGKNAIFRKFEG